MIMIFGTLDKMMISPGSFFSFFSKIFQAVSSLKGQKMAKMSKNYVSCSISQETYHMIVIFGAHV